MKILDNITNTVRDDLRVEIKKGSRVSIAAACFSMYAYKELKKQLETIDEFEFIFTSPTFVKEKAEKQKREFYIPRISRETSLYGTEFEIKLRNEMTQRAIAKECADWIRRKATFKSNTTGENIQCETILKDFLPKQNILWYIVKCLTGFQINYHVPKKWMRLIKIQIMI